MKKKLLYLAMFLLVLCLPFRGNGEEIYWVWTNTTWIPISLIFASLLSIGFHLYREERTSKSKVL
jgi:hypothetical protein